MANKWLVGEIVVDGATHVAVYEPIPGEYRRVKTIALCGKVGAPDERETVRNAMKFALVLPMIEVVQEMDAALGALESLYFAASGEQTPAWPVAEIIRAQAAREHGRKILTSAGV